MMNDSLNRTVRTWSPVGLTRSAAKALINYDDPNSLASRIRKRRIGPLVELLRAAHEQYGHVRILDIGGTRAYWTILSGNTFTDRKVHVTLANFPGSSTPADDKRFTFVAADGCDMRKLFSDGSFHIVHSNSVIEHVGDWQRMTAFAREVRRLAPAYFVQTPNFWFPIEPHFMTPLFHWLPVPARVTLVRRFDLGHRKRQPDIGAAVEQVQSVHLVDRKMFSFLFPDARLVVERVLGLPKSLIAIRGLNGGPGGMTHSYRSP
jgi:hypothetical protein